jgi:2-haloacid dehalogenase
MVAAHQDDLEAAAELGMATAYVLRPDEFGPDVKIAPTRDGAWTHVAGSFTELADQLGC